MKNCRKAKKVLNVSVGDSVCIVRNLQEMSQNELAEKAGILRSIISNVENDLVELDIEQAKSLARVLKCHPAVLVFPGWNVERESRRRVVL